MEVCSFYNNSYKANNNTAFCKKYLDTDVKIRRTDGLKDYGSFVEYERNDPKDAMKIRDIERFWRYNAPFIHDIADSFKGTNREIDNVHVYGLEDKYENTLALAKVISGYDDFEQGNIAIISHIQAAPDEICTSISRRHKGVGETLVSKIVQQAKNTGIDTIKVNSVNEGFWENSKLFQNRPANPCKSEKFLTNENFDSYIAFVESKNTRAFCAWA